MRHTGRALKEMKSIADVQFVSLEDTILVKNQLTDLIDMNKNQLLFQQNIIDVVQKQDEKIAHFIENYDKKYLSREEKIDSILAIVHQNASEIRNILHREVKRRKQFTFIKAIIFSILSSFFGLFIWLYGDLLSHALREGITSTIKSFSPDKTKND